MHVEHYIAENSVAADVVDCDSKTEQARTVMMTMAKMIELAWVACAQRGVTGSKPQSATLGARMMMMMEEEEVEEDVVADF